MTMTKDVDAKGTRGALPGLDEIERASGIAPRSIFSDVDAGGPAERLMASAEAMHEPLHMPDTIAEGRSVGDSTDKILQARGKVHGNFNDHARITQTFKTVTRLELVARAERGQPSLTPCQMEALDMIQHKIGRIVAGDADFRDHWDDICGYARLAAERCSK